MFGSTDVQNNGQYEDHVHPGENTVNTVMIIILNNVLWFENNKKAQERDVLSVVIKCTPYTSHNELLI